MSTSARRHRRLRRLLHVSSALCGVWLVVAVVLNMVAAPAAADNCSVFTDCFNQANSASEAAFGLMLLTALSLALNFIPVVGDIKGITEGAIGRDVFTGEELAPWERAAGMVPILPIGDLARLAGVTARMTGNTADLVRARRAVDGASDLRPGGQAADGAVGTGSAPDATPPGGGVPRPLPTTGATFPLDPGSRRLVDDYRRPGVTTTERKHISEALGERGGVRYLQEATGNPNLRTVRPTTDADVAGFETMMLDGQAWPHAVSFRGSRATNIVYYDGNTLHVIEAKGGDATYGTRMSNWVDKGNRIPQTHPQYPRDVGRDMMESNLRDGRNDIGRIIARSYEEETARYIGIRTGGRSAILRGDPSTTVEDVFLEPTPFE